MPNIALLGRPQVPPAGELSAGDGMIKDALLSDCRTYRYALWRIWDGERHGRRVMFIGLNPSTADETTYDPTIRKCIGFAQRWGYGGFYMLNLFAFRATWPMDLVQADDPVGPDNDQAFATFRQRAELVVACWGGSIATRNRPRLQWQSRIRQVLETINGPVHCLGRTQDGSPKHPNRPGYDTPLELFHADD